MISRFRHGSEQAALCQCDMAMPCASGGEFKCAQLRHLPYYLDVRHPTAPVVGPKDHGPPPSADEIKQLPDSDARMMG